MNSTETKKSEWLTQKDSNYNQFDLTNLTKTTTKEVTKLV